MSRNRSRLTRLNFHNETPESKGLEKMIETTKEVENKTTEENVNLSEGHTPSVGVSEDAVVVENTTHVLSGVEVVKSEPVTGGQEQTHEHQPAYTSSKSQSVRVNVILVREVLAEYVEKMSPGRIIDAEKGAAEQLKLFRMFINVINNYSGDDFKDTMDEILKEFLKGINGVFSPPYAYRFMEQIVNLPEKRIKLFQQLLNMFQLMCEQKARAAASKQLNWHATLSEGITDEGRNKVLKYFNITNI